MNCENRTLMNTQHAPPLVHASRLVPFQSASMNAHLMTGGIRIQIR